MNDKVLIAGSKLKELRSKSGLSQEALCDVFYDQNIRVSIATLKRAELGKNVSYRVVKELASYFDVTVEALLDSSISSHEKAQLFGEKKLELYLFSFLITRQSGFFSNQKQQNVLGEIANYVAKHDFKVIDIIGHYLVGVGFLKRKHQSLYYLLYQLNYIHKHISSKFKQFNITLCVKKSAGVEKEEDLHVCDQDIEELTSIMQQTKQNVFLVDNECYLQTINNFSFLSLNLFPNIETQYFKLTKSFYPSTLR